MPMRREYIINFLRQSTARCSYSLQLLDATPVTGLLYVFRDYRSGLAAACLIILYPYK